MLEHLDANPGRYDLSSVVGHHLVGRDVEPGEQAGPAASTCPRRCCSTRSARPRPSASAPRCRAPGAAEQTAQFMLGREQRGVHRRRPPRRAGLGRAWAWSPSAASSRSATTRTRPSRRRRSAPSTGRRWSVPGDFAEVNADGTLHLLGRGSVCINTGGEKVFPEEVEEALKTHPAVRDAVVRRRARRALRRGDLRASSSRADGADLDAADAVAPTSAASSPPTRRRATSSSSTPSAGPPTARSTTSA